MQISNLIDKLPSHMQDFRELIYIMQNEKEELETVLDESQTMVNRSFVLLADEIGIELYEKMLDITKTPEQTLEERRLQVLMKMNEQPPYTLESYSETLTNLFGDGIIVNFSYEDFTFEVEISTSMKDYYNSIQSSLNYVLPCNISSLITIIYNTNAALNKCTHAYLNQFSHIVIKSASL